jgi:glycerol-3-phosphate dehydrogenase
MTATTDPPASDPAAPAPFDLAIVGGGINGVGIARDAAMRGLKVLLCDKDDLGAHTSSASSKLIHGGLRYLEHYEFRLVGEALAEREVMLEIAPHLVRPMEFCLPHVAELRPAWMIRAGLFLYDRLGRRKRLPGSRAVELRASGYGDGLRADITRGFVYSDCWVDDARLVTLTARSAADHGALVLPRTRCLGGCRIEVDGRKLWAIDLQGGGARTTVRARALVNAAGPWVKQILTDQLGHRIPQNVKQVKGSHIVVPRCYRGEHAYIVQNDDRRIVFLIPYERDFTLIGTTDVETDSIEDRPRISAEEVDYLCRAANRYLAKPIVPDDIVWTFSGVRPLYDDGTTDPSSITRDYVLTLDDADGEAPLLSVFGGKITTYRKLAEAAMERMAPFLPGLPPGRTGREPLPGGDLPGADFAAFVDGLAARHPRFDRALLHALARRHGSTCEDIIGEAADAAGLGERFGDTLYAAEVDHLLRREWATTAEDVLWRRTKCGLHMSAAERERVSAYIDGARLAEPPTGSGPAISSVASAS